MLSPYKVLDLSDERGHFAGRFSEIWAPMWFWSSLLMVRARAIPDLSIRTSHIAIARWDFGRLIATNAASRSTSIGRIDREKLRKLAPARTF